MARTRTHNRRRLQAIRTPNEREKRLQVAKARRTARNKRNARHG